MAVIVARDLTKRFGSVLAVDHLSFDVEEGTIVGFLGPNGAGKTTTLRILLGLVAPTEGHATVCGRPYRDLREPLRRVGTLLDASNAHPGRSARAHLRIQALAARTNESRIDEVLELVGLLHAAERRTGAFSMGMRQRLGLAAALLADPDVLILDEPANGLDPQGVRWLRDLLQARAEEGKTVLVSSHILAEVAQTVDQVMIIDDGRLIVQATLPELIGDSAPVVRVRTPRADELAAALNADGAQARLLAPERVEISGSTPERVAALAAERAIPIVESATEAPDLEDVFLKLTAAAGAQRVER
jgi:ABC-2 type transport system ATP-binding protein